MYHLLGCMLVAGEPWEVKCLCYIPGHFHAPTNYKILGLVSTVVKLQFDDLYHLWYEDL